MVNNKVYIAYVPHGVSTKYFFPIDEEKDVEYKKFREGFQKVTPADFIIFWNNRNIRRKQPGDVILAYRKFCDSLPKKQADKALLLMHTQISDPNGTDLMAVKKAICPKYRIVFSDQKISTAQLNYYYNIADVTINIANAEGFGLSGAESLMAGTPIINTVTGGLQDQCRFEDEEGNWIDFHKEFSSNHTGKYKKCGEWAKPVFPTSRTLQGSPITPYIFEDHCKIEDVSDRLMEWYKMSREKRKAAGYKGYEWILSKESGMSSTEMCNKFKDHLGFLLQNWEKPPRFVVEKIESNNKEKDTGITW